VVDALVLLVPLPKLVTFPTLEKPVEDAEAASFNGDSEVNSSEDETSPEMSDEDAKKKIAKGILRTPNSRVLQDSENR
jgi:translation initiation factor 4G